MIECCKRYPTGRLGVGGSNPLAPTNKSPGNTGLFAFLAVAAERTNPQQNHPKSPECDRNHRSNHRSDPGRFTLLVRQFPSRHVDGSLLCCAVFPGRLPPPHISTGSRRRDARGLFGRHTSGLTKTVGSTSPSMAAASVRMNRVRCRSSGASVWLASRPRLNQ